MLYSIPQMLQCYIAHPHIFLYLDYFIALKQTQNCPAEARGGIKARREAGSLGI